MYGMLVIDRWVSMHAYWEPANGKLTHASSTRSTQHTHATSARSSHADTQRRGALQAQAEVVANAKAATSINGSAPSTS